VPVYVNSFIQLLRSRGWQQQDLAARLRISGSTVSQWATGKRPVTRRLEDAFLSLVVDSCVDAPLPAEMAVYVHRWHMDMQQELQHATTEICTILTRMGQVSPSASDGHWSSVECLCLAHDARRLTKALTDLHHDQEICTSMIEKLRLALRGTL
jgi:hypothetical protein